MLALISLSLGVINLFPFLPLDGGHIFWSVVEKVRGRPVPFRIMEQSGVLGFMLVIFLFLIGLSNDIGRLTGDGFTSADAAARYARHRRAGFAGMMEEREWNAQRSTRLPSPRAWRERRWPRPSSTRRWRTRDRVALRTRGGESEITWGEYVDQVDRVALGLRGLGVARATSSP